MNEPDFDLIQSLIKSNHQDGLPHWNTKQKIQAYNQLRRLSFVWFRKEELNNE